jgi:hypothetical protein
MSGFGIGISLKYPNTLTTNEKYFAIMYAASVFERAAFPAVLTTALSNYIHRGHAAKKSE